MVTRNLLAISFFYYILGQNPATYQKPYFITWGLTIPIFGWLTDVYIGRHRMIHWSTWIMWAAFILVTVSSVVEQFVESYNHFIGDLTLALLIIASMGFGGYQANVIQFGLDQLHDASTDEITSFITWYVWTSISGGIAVDYMNMWIPRKLLILASLLVCVCLSLVLILSLSSEKLVIKEPVTQNPFKLVYRVVKYAMKHKRPRCRSAFTYCEDNLPSRIDFGKKKYGGLFTTEQVEDVKTFFRLLSVVFLGCAMPSVVIVVNQLSNRIIHRNIPGTQSDTIIYKSYAPLPFYTATVIIPMYKFVLYPVLRKHFSWVKSHHKFLLGVLLQIARAITFMVFALKAQYTYMEPTNHNATTQTECLFQKNSGLNFDGNWMVLPNILNSFSIATLAIGGAEFICSQTPYSMRGLMFGAVYGSVAIFALVEYGITQLFTIKSMTWGTWIFGCEFWYLLLNIIFLGIDGVMLAFLGRWYKKRKREDVLPNEHIYAERYYTNY